MSDLPIIESRKLTKDERLTERSKLSRAYRKEVQEQRNELHALYPELMREIDERFRAGTIATLPELTERLLEKLNAIHITPSYRPILLNYLSAHLAALNERAGLPTFNDPLPDQPDDFFIRMRRLLVGTEVHTPMGPGRLCWPTSANR
jgi:hypothetical protein